FIGAGASVLFVNGATLSGAGSTFRILANGNNTNGVSGSITIQGNITAPNISISTVASTNTFNNGSIYLSNCTLTGSNSVSVTAGGTGNVAQSGTAYSLRSGNITLS